MKWSQVLTPNNVFNSIAGAATAVTIAGVAAGFPKWLVIVSTVILAASAKASRGAKATRKKLSPLLDTSAIDRKTGNVQ
jgi:hypothetical protein